VKNLYTPLERRLRENENLAIYVLAIGFGMIALIAVLLIILPYNHVPSPGKDGGKFSFPSDSTPASQSASGAKTGSTSNPGGSQTPPSGKVSQSPGGRPGRSSGQTHTQTRPNAPEPSTPVSAPSRTTGKPRPTSTPTQATPTPPIKLPLPSLPVKLPPLPKVSVSLSVPPIKLPILTVSVPPIGIHLP
jgi:hypothetical protein